MQFFKVSSFIHARRVSKSHLKVKFIRNFKALFPATEPFSLFLSFMLEGIELVAWV